MSYKYLFFNQWGGAIRNIKMILPDQRKLFIPIISEKSEIVLGECVNGKDSPICSIFDPYVWERYNGETICMEIYFKWGEKIPMVDLIKKIAC